jgi:hypothetical protein
MLSEQSGKPGAYVKHVVATFAASDGQEFDSEQDAAQHQRRINLQWWVKHNHPLEMPSSETELVEFILRHAPDLQTILNDCRTMVPAFDGLGVSW